MCGFDSRIAQQRVKRHMPHDEFPKVSTDKGPTYGIAGVKKNWPGSRRCRKL